MKRLIVLFVLVVTLLGLVLLGNAHSSASVADTTILDNDVTTSVSEIKDSSSASATTMITWRTAPLPEE